MSQGGTLTCKFDLVVNLTTAEVRPHCATDSVRSC